MKTIFFLLLSLGFSQVALANCTWETDPQTGNEVLVCDGNSGSGNCGWEIDTNGQTVWVCH